MYPSRSAEVRPHAEREEYDRELHPWATPAHREFDFAPRTRIVFGPGRLDRLGELARQYGDDASAAGHRPGNRPGGTSARGRSSRSGRPGFRTSFSNRVVENPTTQTVDDCLALARQEGIDFLVGLGGGSSMDTAKGCNFLLSNGGRMEDYSGRGQGLAADAPPDCRADHRGHGQRVPVVRPDRPARDAREDGLRRREGRGQGGPAGPRADAQPASRRGREHGDGRPEPRGGVGRRQAAEPDVADVFPRGVPALARGLRRVFEDPKDVSARGDVLLGAALGDLAIEYSMLGAAHAAANPLTPASAWYTARRSV